MKICWHCRNSIPPPFSPAWLHGMRRGSINGTSSPSWESIVRQHRVSPIPIKKFQSISIGRQGHDLRFLGWREGFCQLTECHINPRHTWLLLWPDSNTLLYHQEKWLGLVTPVCYLILDSAQCLHCPSWCSCFWFQATRHIIHTLRTPTYVVAALRIIRRIQRFRTPLSLPSNWKTSLRLASPMWSQKEQMDLLSVVSGKEMSNVCLFTL